MSESRTNGHVRVIRPLEREEDDIVQRNEEAESAVIASVLKDHTAFARVADLLAPGDFYVPKYRSMFDAMKTLWATNQPIDYVTMGEVGEGYTLFDLADVDLIGSTASHIEYYADIIKKHSRLRTIASHCYNGFLRAFRDDADPDEVVQSVMRSLQVLDTGGIPVFNGEELAHRFMEDLTTRRTGERVLTPTGLLNIDHFYGGGFAAGTLNLLMGVTGMGKTELALQIAFWIGEHIGNVLYVSLEMEDIELLQRIGRVEGGLDRNALASGNLSDEQADTALAVCQRVAGSNFYVTCPIERYTTDTLRAQCLKLRQKVQAPLKLVVLDYVQRLDDIAGKNSSREQDVALMAKNLKSLARELHCPVLALVQPNRDYATRPNKRPRLSDLRESGRLEIEADTAAGIYREEFFYENSGRENQADLFMLKNRSGIGIPVGASASLLWNIVNAGAGRYMDLDYGPGERPTSRETRRPPARQRRARHEQEDQQQAPEELPFA